MSISANEGAAGRLAQSAGRPRTFAGNAPYRQSGDSAGSAPCIPVTASAAAAALLGEGLSAFFSGSSGERSGLSCSSGERSSGSVRGGGGGGVASSGKGAGGVRNASLGPPNVGDGGSLAPVPCGGYASPWTENVCPPNYIGIGQTMANTQFGGCDNSSWRDRFNGGGIGAGNSAANPPVQMAAYSPPVLDVPLQDPPGPCLGNAEASTLPQEASFIERGLSFFGLTTLFDNAGGGGSGGNGGTPMPQSGCSGCGSASGGDGGCGGAIPCGSCGACGNANPGGGPCDSGGGGFHGGGGCTNGGCCSGWPGSYSGCGMGCGTANCGACPQMPMAIVMQPFGELPHGRPPWAQNSHGWPPGAQNSQVVTATYPWNAPFHVPKFSSSESCGGLFGSAQTQVATEQQSPEKRAHLAGKENTMTALGLTMKNLTQMSEPQLAALFEKHAPDALSIGGLLHKSNSCTPCLFWAKAICFKGLTCTYCHMVHEGVKTKRIRLCKRTRDCLKSSSSSRARGASSDDQRDTSQTSTGVSSPPAGEGVPKDVAINHQRGRVPNASRGEKIENRSTKQSL
eukprot:TRINITY_DN5819_c0_g3_i1.p1 TRINITY_DN5819_c0_g3~~TRINITY_DN5819_c0_g3_i1.p1  ORF type:complete len:568 (-),score=63.24 TRINITY_DN5819_c0_g3_i1:53-1756(-)